MRSWNLTAGDSKNAHFPTLVPEEEFIVADKERDTIREERDITGEECSVAGKENGSWRVGP